MAGARLRDPVSTSHHNRELTRPDDDDQCPVAHTTHCRVSRIRSEPAGAPGPRALQQTPGLVRCPERWSIPGVGCAINGPYVRLGSKCLPPCLLRACLAAANPNPARLNAVLGVSE